MATFQDSSVGVSAESTYKTYVAPARHIEFLDETLNWNKQVKQGQGLRVGGRVDRAARRVVPAADGGGDITLECASKGLGLLWQAALGTGTATLVAVSTYQHLFTLGDTPPSLTVQVGIPEVGGTVDAYSWLGCMVDSWELDIPNNDIASLKLTLDAGDLSTAQTYVAPVYPAAPVNLFHFGNASFTTGTFTAPTSTALAASVSALVDVRALTVQVNNNVRDDRYNGGGGGRKSKPTVGKRAITGTITFEYDSSTYRDLILNDNTLVGLVATLTGGALSTGNETLQVALPAIKLDGDLPKPNGPDLITYQGKFTALDDLTNQPIYVVARTADAAL